MKALLFTSSCIHYNVEYLLSICSLFAIIPLGNSTMEKLQKVVSGYTACGLGLDVHCNLFGPTALLKVCKQLWIKFHIKFEEFKPHVSPNY